MSKSVIVRENYFAVDGVTILGDGSDQAPLNVPGAAKQALAQVFVYTVLGTETPALNGFDIPLEAPMADANYIAQIQVCRFQAGGLNDARWDQPASTLTTVRVLLATAVAAGDKLSVAVWRFQ